MRHGISRNRFGLALAAMALASLALAGCSGDDGSAGAPGADAFTVQSIAPPAGPAGQFTVNTAGGTGTAGSGGNGGYVDLEMDYGSMGGNIKIFKTGQANAAFTFPANVSTYLGLVPLNIATSTTIAVVAAEPATGTPYMVLNDSNVYISDGDTALADETPVTGISIASGATLTLGLNWSTYAGIVLSNDLSNAGTLTVAKLDAVSSGGLDIECDVYYGATGSSIVTSGADNPAGAGGNGGWIDFDCEDANWAGIVTQEPGGFFNRGTIDASGGDGSTSGGLAGSFYVWTGGPAYNSGNITTTGGNGAAGNGGDGARIQIDTDYGNNFNSGNLNASGGHGTGATAFGGNAGYVYLYIAYPGDLLNSGDLTSNGGNGAAGGGNGAYIEFYVYGGRIVNSGDLTSLGGMATTGAGGNGGYLDIEAYYDSGWKGYYQPLADWNISGNIDLSGGDGLTGGQGGYIYGYMDNGYVADSQEIIFYGYTGIDTSGGATTDGTGGSAGYVYLYNYYGYNDFLYYTPSGGVINYADVTAKGGASTNGAGGNGNYVELYTDDYYGYATDGEVAYNFGKLDLAGGAGATLGGNAGFAYLWGYNHAENAGQIIATGGAATSGLGGAGAAGNGVYILSDLGVAVNSASINANGGNGGTSGTGGNAGHIELVGYAARNTAALAAAGGDATGAASVGGNASVIFLYGIFEGTSNSATSFDVTAGSGTTAGTSGEVYIDNQNVTSKYL